MFEMNSVSFLFVMGDSTAYSKLWLALPDLAVFKPACFCALMGVRGAPTGLRCL